MAPGASIVCTATYNITQTDLNNGSVTNTASATAKDPNNVTITSNQAQATVNASKLVLSKNVGTDYLFVGWYGD